MKKENRGAAPRIIVMQPTVINVNGPSEQNVAWKEIPLTQGLSTKVDIIDYDFLMQWKWLARKSRDTYYAERNSRKGECIKRTRISMHRVIMNTPDDMQTDHQDWDGLNNRRYNLRNCTVNQNRSWIRPRSKTGYLGVSEHRWFKKKTGTWGISYGVSVTHNGVVYDLGTTRNIIVAAQLYDTKAKELKGEFANLNFPKETPGQKYYRENMELATGTSQEINCVHSNIDYPGRCAWHTSEFCKKKCAFNSALQDVDDDGY